MPTNKEWLYSLDPHALTEWFDAEHVSESEPPASQNVSEKPGASLSDLYGILSDEHVQKMHTLDSREKLEADVRKSLGFTTKDVFGWLDRQAAITEREIFDEMPYIRDKMRGLQAQVDSMTVELHASNREREHLRNQLGIALDHAHDICSLVDLDGNVLP